jgi:hypothetical protein
VGDLGHLSGIGDISLDSWNAVEVFTPFIL